MAKLSDFIQTYKLPNYLVDTILSTLNSTDTEWQQHHWYNHSNKKRTTHSEEIEPKILNLQSSVDELLDNLLIHVTYYSHTFSKEGVFISNFSFPRFNKYVTGNRMKSHIDHVHSLFDGENRGIPALTILGSLSSDYEGGEFVFNLIDEDISYKLDKGDFLIFPSNFMYPHEVKPILSGTRLSFVVWAY